MSFDPVRIPEVIEEAGLSATEIILSVDGTLVEGEEFLELDVPELERAFLLVGGAHLDRLTEGADLIATKLRVTGQLRPRRRGSATDTNGRRVPGSTLSRFAWM